MAESRIRTYTPHGERSPQHIFTDHDWVREHEAELISQYGECYVIVFHEVVLGTGKTRQEAIESAETNLPSEVEIADVMVDWIGQHYHIYSVRALSEFEDEPD
jgi:hypothetical protein